MKILVPPQLQLIKELKVLLLTLIGEQIRAEEVRERKVTFLLTEHEPINVTITLIAGRWTMVGSVMVRFENFPITYNETSFNADFSVLLLGSDMGTSPAISTEMIYLNSTSVPLENPQTFELWIKDQTTIAWND